jgi:hypothetical protein
MARRVRGVNRAPLPLPLVRRIVASYFILLLIVSTHGGHAWHASLSFIVVTLIALTPEVSAQSSQLFPWEIEIDVETPTKLAIYDGEGNNLHSTTISTSSSWKGDLNTPSNCTVPTTCDWSFEWEAETDTEILFFRFRLSSTNEVLGTYAYVPATERDGRGTFYLPWEGQLISDWDTYFEVVYENGEYVTKAGRGAGTLYEDEFSGLYTIPYDLPYYCAQTGCNANADRSFLAKVDYIPIPQFPGEPYREFTLAAEADARVISDWSPTWDVQDLVVKAPPSRKLVVEGDLTAEDVTFAEADAGLGWGGVAVYAGGTLDFDGVTVSDAEVGVDVYSDGNTFTNSFFTGNGVGIRSSYEQDYCDGLPACFIGDRSSFTLDQSCVTESEFDLGSSEGYGIWARGTDATVMQSTVEGNDAYGLRLDDADVAARSLLLADNGTGSSTSSDGVRAASNGDLTLASYFEGTTGRGTIALGLNSVRDNARHEISLSDEGYTTVGLVCSLTSCPDANRVSEAGFPGDFDFLIRNEPKEDIQAHRTYWATSPADPPDAAFLRPEYVEDFQPLTSDPAASAGRPGGCTAPSARGSDPSGTSFASYEDESAARGDGPGGLDAETAAWLRGQMREMRQALADAPGADGAAARLRALYALQRLDRADVLGEHAATAALLRSLYAPLSGGGAIPPPRRATAEVALTVALHDALRHGAYDQGRALLSDLGERVEGADTRRALDLVAVALDEQAGDYEGALGRVYALLDGLDSEDQLAHDLESTAALLEDRLDAEGRTATARYASAEEQEAAVRADAADAVLWLAYPNPVADQAHVPIVLAEAAEARVAVYDVLGREVGVLHEGVLDAGAHRFRFDGSGLPAGVYLVRAAVTAGRRHGRRCRPDVHRAADVVAVICLGSSGPPPAPLAVASLPASRGCPPRCEGDSFASPERSDGSQSGGRLS